MITLRHARKDDCILLYHWRNEAETVQACATQTPVAWDEHERWLTMVLSQQSEWQLYIAEASRPELDIDRDQVPQAVGVGRLQRAGENRAVLSYSVPKAFHGQGYGGQIIAALCVEAHRLGYRSLRADAR